MLFIMSGLPGFGKSTWIQNFLKAPEGLTYKICSADLYHMVEGRYEFKVENLGKAHTWCFRECQEALRSDYDLIFVDNTNLEAWEISPYIALANLAGVPYKIIKLEVEDPMQTKDIFERNVHGVPSSSFMGMIGRANHPWPKFWNVEKVRVQL